MNIFGNAGRGGDFDPSSMESLLVTQAITEVHKKLLLAEKKDALLQIGEAEGTYRHRKLSTKDFGNGLQRHASILLVPRVDRAQESHVARLLLDMPTIAWDKASETLRGMYRANIEENVPNQFDGTSVTDLSQPRYIPTRDIFGEAVSTNGESIKFLLSPIGLHAYESDSDIGLTVPALAEVGQQYIVETGFATYEAQAELATEWFDTAKLSQIISDYEPITFDGTTGVSAA